MMEDPLCEESATLIRILVEALPQMPQARPVGNRFEERLRNLLTPPMDRPLSPAPAPQVITAEDVERAVEELHLKQCGI